MQIGAVGQLAQHAAQFGRADRCGDVAPPQAHVEIRVLAAEELERAHGADAPAAERQQEEGDLGLVEGGDDRRGDAGLGAEMCLPMIQEIVTLIRCGEASGAFERAPGSFGGGHVVIDNDLGDRAIDRDRPAFSRKTAQGDDIHAATGSPESS